MLKDTVRPVAQGRDCGRNNDSKKKNRSSHKTLVCTEIKPDISKDRKKHLNN